MTIYNPKFRHQPENLDLRNDEIHVWCLSLKQLASRIQLLSQTLSPDECVRAERFHFEKDRNNFIISRGILRTILGNYLNIEPGKLQFCYGKYGKPSLSDISGNGKICFNASRSEGTALYAFTWGHEIGVDIEHVRDISDMYNIVEQFFSVTENEAFCVLPEDSKKEAFFNYWTRKEAFIKAMGDGLHCPLDEFEVPLFPGKPIKLLSIEEDLKESSQWFFQDLEPFSGFAAAIALEGVNLQLRYYQWSDSLLKI